MNLLAAIEFLTRMQQTLDVAKAILTSVGIEWDEVEDMVENARREGRSLSEAEIAELSDQADSALEKL